MKIPGYAPPRILSEEERAEITAKDITVSFPFDDKHCLDGWAHVQRGGYAFSLRVADAEEMRRLVAEAPDQADEFMRSHMVIDEDRIALVVARKAYCELTANQAAFDRWTREALGIHVKNARRVSLGDIDITEGGQDTLHPHFMLLTFLSLLLFRNGEHGNLAPKVENMINMAETARYEEYLSKAWDALDPQQQEIIKERFNKRVLKALEGGGSFEARTKEVILQKIAELAEHEVEKRLDQLRDRVIAEVEKRWADMVEQLVSKRLAEALSKVKAEMAR